MTIARYTFLPWMRRGLGSQIKDPAGPGQSRARLEVTLTVASDAADAPPVPPITKSIKLVGPGDLTGLKPHQVVRTEPRGGVADFEPNYLAAIDLYDEDFPWRYSPAPPDLATHRLTPWVVLTVLKDGEFEWMTIPDRPVPAVRLKAGARKEDLFPVAGQEYAWAHVHVNAGDGTGTAPDLAALDSLLSRNPDAAYARIVCPRKLDPNSSYTACLLPTFEVGRRAGLGEAVADTDDGSVRSWAGGALEFPVYFEWRFRTGVEGDFESLVRALVPRDIDPRVGVRDMNIERPGFGIPSVTNPPDDDVSLEGALLAPTTERRGLDSASDFAPQVAPIVNAPADALNAAVSAAIGAEDPVVAPPLYGGWHAGVQRVESTALDPGWIPALNLDPRYRAAAGLGARVVRKNQEGYLRSAWEQIGDVLTVNAKIRRGQLAIKAAYAAYSKTLMKVEPTRAAAIASPVFAKVMGSPRTLRAITSASRLPRAALSPAFRKLLRPRGRVSRAMLPRAEAANAITRVAEGINDGTLSAAPPPPMPDGATLEAVSAARRPPAWMYWLRKHLLWLLLVLAALVLIAWAAIGASAALTVALVAGGALAAAWIATQIRASAMQAADMFVPAQMTAAAIVAVPPQPAYVFDAPADAALVTIAGPPLSPPPGGDSADGADMRRALADLHTSLDVHVEKPAPRPALDIAHVHASAMAALEPHAAFASRFAPMFRVGGQDVVTFAEGRYATQASRPGLQVFREVMNYPDIKDAMYLPLSDISKEYFVPNLGLIPNNTISLMKTNQEFIESYLVGVNHEFARELLWNEYPTDMQGSYFRQFWDVSNYVDRQNRDAKQLAEDLKDIPRIHQWPRTSELGAHNQRDAQGDKTQVVLVVRGDLLKRYPNTIIYAQQATWAVDAARPNRLVLADETGELYTTKPDDPRLRYPLYRAFVAPDIYFIGFDLTLKEVKGAPSLAETSQARATLGNNNLGWFFVLQEVVGEPRFGLDAKPPEAPKSPPIWDDLSWTNLDLSSGQRIDVGKALLSTAAGPRNGGITWGANASDMAFILYQKPVMVGVHGREMLKNLVLES